MCLPSKRLRLPYTCVTGWQADQRRGHRVDVFAEAGEVGVRPVPVRGHEAGEEGALGAAVDEDEVAEGPAGGPADR